MSKITRAVVLGGSGMIGSLVVQRLKSFGVEVAAASRRSGVDTVTGEGLDAVLSGADIVIDTSDVHSFDEITLREFFLVSGENVAKAERKAGVRHHVTLSIVGVENLLGNPYYKAKFAQENLARSSGVPFTIVQSTQFFEFLPTIAGGFTKGALVRPPDAMLQPIAADNVGGIIAELALGQPSNRTVQIAGPERAGISLWLERAFAVTNDTRNVVVDANATWFGAPLQKLSLVPVRSDRTGASSFDEWSKTRDAQRILGLDRYKNAAADLEAQIVS
ncbi:NAD(P)H-binding protein [Rhizobium sp. CG4]|uniref:SDR family oxidoreductase n=1 Tax=Rhizobium sp. CG4 TaxID=2726075 RepID=UPI00203459B9|nr:NAD(P)H-binding protein [Rhizobium sp. CG4]MCM2458155.1 NAD(P)H-binding protein [Rhizobium sp. CG4]